MNIVILYGTESGTSEMLADDIADSLNGAASIADMATFDPAELVTDSFYLVVCSTYGDGELPASAQPFAEALESDKPDLTGVSYAVFGLGDSGYADSFAKGSELLDRQLTQLGATRVGPITRHDAAGYDDASELAVAWARETLAPISLAV